MSIESDIAEAVSRMRRIETRLTAYLVRQGEPVGGHKPSWNRENNTVVVPHPDCSISSCMNVIPESFETDVDVYLPDGQWIATVQRGNL